MVPSPSNLLPFPTRAPLPRWKRIIDILGCACALPFVVPLMLVMVVVTSFWAKGPVLFRQERVGLGGRRFTMFKFRTMKTGASSATHEAHALDFIKNNRPMVKMDVKGDDRLIPLGRFLRATGLDELPQIFNVLQGEMSLVGPRPCIPYEYEAYLPWQKERFTAVPGLTGLWQVSGKNNLSFEEMIHLDIRYARTLSLGLDLKIIMETPRAIFSQVRETLSRHMLPEKGPLPPSHVPPAPTYRDLALGRNARRQIVQFRYADPSATRDSLAGETLP